MPDSISFLLDENVDLAIERGLRKREPAIVVYIVEHGEAPDLGTPDPDLLHWMENHGAVLVTNNRSTMPAHLMDHLASDGHIPGILIIPRNISVGNLVDESHLIWAASAADEYTDQIRYLP